ncbi:hypothetical protein GALMADRAFT_210842 [Galerina marginata CBS 339.88]|uniref:Uncharacterized protein n=1 Tax=Galerina marginata (strain CBS 339.88) TaxID=685588 RepID=A0A067TB06_GALM3|nr:hypothetical protein GALMADRAFT_210842 [Galerina marginata CBS 339.88]
MTDSSNIPKLEHIPLLEGTTNALEWFRSMTQTLKAEGVWGHVEGVQDDLAAVWQASEPPPLTALSTNAQRQASTAWWIKDSRALSIIDRRLNPITQSLMPVGDDVTSRMVWNKLKSMYSRVDVHAQFDLRDRLAANKLRNASDYIRFLGEFNTCRSRLATMDAPLTEIESIHTLMRQLPHDTTWPHFKQSISHFVQTWSEIEATRDPPSPHNTLYTKVITRLEQECITLQAHSQPVSGPGTEYANLATIKKTSRNPLGVVCTNCGLDNHDFNHCWKKGGGAAGQWPGGPNDPKIASEPDTAAYLGDLSC